jgi:biotin carboxylase
MKKLLILGGSGYIIPVIKKAHELGLYVVTCDYLPNNIAHKYSDEFWNISIIEKDKVLEAAEKNNIDGVISFACDPGVASASYVAEKMGLLFQGSYESVSILQDKGLFRQFLTDHGFNVPHAKRYTDKKKPFDDIDFFTWPVIVKPTDSAGSKGVTRVNRPEDLPSAIDIAVAGSHNDAFIIEDFLTFQGYHSSADPFTVDGKLEFVSYSDQLFDAEAENPYTPARIIWPTTMTKEHQNYLTSETQRLMDLLNMRTGIYNIETCVGADGRPYLMEVSPRGGGCRIAELQEMAMGVPLIENEIRKAVDMPLVPMNEHQIEGHWCEMIIHNRREQQGVLKSIDIDKEFQDKYIRLLQLTSKPGDYVEPFTGANKSLGDMFMQFDSREELDRITDNIGKYLKINLE